MKTILLYALLTCGTYFAIRFILDTFDPPYSPVSKRKSQQSSFPRVTP